MTRTIIQKQGIRKIIQTLNQWSKKPSLDQDLSGILDEYQSYVEEGAVNFAETAIIIQFIGNLYVKRIDLLFEKFYSLSIRLCSALRRPEEENQNKSNTPATAEDKEQATETVEVQQNTVEPPTQVQDKQSKKEPKTPEKPKKARKRKIEQVGDTPKKLSIPGLPDEFLESLNLTNCNIDEVVRECLSKLTPTHPLYSVFAQIGDKISRTRNVITYNNISLTGNCWNVLYILENLLNKNKQEIGESSSTQENSGNLAEISSAVDNTQTSESNVSNAADSAENSSSPDGNIQNTLMCTQISENGVENINEMYEDNNNETISHTEPDSSVNEDISCTNNTDSVNTPDITETTTSNTEISSNITESTPVESNNNEISNVDAKSNNTETQVEANSEISSMETSQVTSTLSDTELRTNISRKCKVELKDMKINLLRLPDKVLLKVDYFRLSSEYFDNNKKKKAEQKIKNLLKTPEVLTRKRKREMEAECRRLMKSIKSYDLNTFEEFCYSYNCSQGIHTPIPEKITITVLPEKVCPNRKSVDNHSVVSYGCPVTPADSGHFSSSFITDSDYADNDSDHRRTSSRADSGVFLMSPPHESQIDSALPFSSEPVPSIEDPMFSTLKEMFPNTFADPQRFEVLKNIVRPPEKQGESENYLEWKKYIEEKSSKDVEFNIHEYGSEILNVFPTKTKNEVINFQNVVCHKPVTEVSRYFVSMLQLANTYNIEICEERQGEINADGVKLKFLSDERPHEEFEELNLPSESQFFASLDSSQIRHSTPSTSHAEKRSRTCFKNPAKKRRIN